MLAFQTEIFEGLYQNRERIGLQIGLVIGLVLVATIVNWITIIYAQIITKNWETPIALKRIDKIEEIQLNISKELETKSKKLFENSENVENPKPIINYQISNISKGYFLL